MKFECTSPNFSVCFNIKCKLKGKNQNDLKCEVIFEVIRELAFLEHGMPSSQTVSNNSCNEIACSFASDSFEARFFSLSVKISPLFTYTGYFLHTYFQTFFKMHSLTKREVRRCEIMSFKMK